MSSPLRFGSFSRLTRVKPGLHIHRSPGFSFSSWNNERHDLLQRVYAPFARLEDENAPEYRALAESGKVWEDYFQPGDSEGYGYFKLQKLHAPLLKEIDSWKDSLKTPRGRLIHSLVADYAHQSVFIEHNKLLQGHSALIDAYLASTLSNAHLASLSATDLAQQITLPDVHFLIPHADASQVAELRNHLVASHWVTETALQNPFTAGLSQDQVQSLSAVIVKGTDSELTYKYGWGGKVVPGDYRSAPIQVKSNPLRIFPYHIEVPACLNRFFQWLDRMTREKRLHPLIIACQATAYFLHIHPFPDGNGRVSRLIMQDYMARHGYVPVVIQNLQRQDYLRMIQGAQDGQPDEFVHTILTTQLEELKTLRMREVVS